MTLKIKILVANATILHVGQDIAVLFSYETAVAAVDFRGGFRKFLVHENRFSSTTSKHIGLFLAEYGAKTKDASKCSDESFASLLTVGN